MVKENNIQAKTAKMFMIAITSIAGIFSIIIALILTRAITGPKQGSNLRSGDSQGNNSIWMWAKRMRLASWATLKQMQEKLRRSDCQRHVGIR